MAAELLSGRRAAVISDDAVFPLYGALAERSLQDAGFQVEHFVFPHGEQQKNLNTYGQALNFLCDRRFTRSDLIVALGGGVVGDLAGFTAATYQRGVAYIQVPTTLLSMVDSSVGGKTAVDLDSGKNQAGCFYQPSLVLCDPALLASLPEAEYRAGCAEVIKTAVLFSPELFQKLTEAPVREQFESVIAACVGMKRDVVENDEFDRGQRALLNLGHTIGHAVEACSNFTILHGEGVAIGMVLIAQVCEKAGITPPGTADKLARCCKIYGLPTANPYPVETLCGHARGDKKRAGNKITLITLDRIGKAALHPVPVEKLEAFMRGDLHG